MSSDPRLPFDSSTSAPKNPASSPPQVNDLFAANKAVNQQNAQLQYLMPALGLPTVSSYRASGRSGPLGLPLLVLSLLLLPILGALLYEKLGQFGSMLMFSELLLAVLLGGAMFATIHFGKVRNPGLAALVGGVIGLTAFLGTMGLEASGYRADYVSSDVDYLVKNRGVQPQKAQAMVEAYYTLPNLVKTYWEDRAAAGLTITKSGSLTSTHVSGAPFWFAKVIEFICAVFVVGAMSRFFANRRFSEKSDCWYKTANIGLVHQGYFDEMMAAAKASEWSQIRSMLTTEANRGGSQICAAYLPGQPGGLLTIKAKVHKNKNPEPIFEKELSNEEMKAVWPAFPASVGTAQPFAS